MPFLGAMCIVIVATICIYSIWGFLNLSHRAFFASMGKVKKLMGKVYSPYGKGDLPLPEKSLKQVYPVAFQVMVELNHFGGGWIPSGGYNQSIEKQRLDVIKNGSPVNAEQVF